MKILGYILISIPTIALIISLIYAMGIWLTLAVFSISFVLAAMLITGIRLIVK